MITYTTKHSSGLVKVRKSKGHTAPIYTHAVWVDFDSKPRGSVPPGDYTSGRRGWECRSIARENTARYEASRYERAGYKVEIADVVAQ